MSTYSEVVQQIQKFGKTQYAAVADTICGTLHKGPILNPGLASIKQVMQAIGDAMPIVMHNHHEDSADEHPNQPLKDRVIEHFCFYMSGLLGCDEELIMPLTYYAKVTSSSYLAINRTSPILIAPAKLEKKLIKETESGLDYKGDDILFAILFSMALSKALEPLLETTNDVTQISLPHKRGIFIGSARRKAEPPCNEFDVSIYTISSASRHKKAKTETLSDPNFRVTSKIVSFIRFEMMNPDQRALHRRLDELRHEEQFMKDLASSFETFSRPLLYRPEELVMREHIFARAVERVSDLVASPEWRDACTLRKNYFNGNQFKSTHGLQ